jgi:NADPH:quinone reductase-like Zn-dependent oxidoreductase
MKSKASKENNEKPKLTSNFVGVVCHCSKEATEIFGIRQGTRVASFIPWLANAKYVTIPPKYLVAVSKKLDAADVVSVTSFFLPSFELLHFGRERSLRHSQKAIKGKRVFIKTSGVTLQVQALIRLSRFAGASEVYVSAPRDQLSSLVKQRVATLSDEPDCWLPVVRGGMDLVLDLDFPADLNHVKKSLARKGRLICCRNPKHKEVKNACSPFIHVEHLLERSQLAVMKRASLFSFVEYVNEFRTGVCKDLEFLFKLLQRRQIRPKIDRFITLHDLPDVDDEIKNDNLSSGAVICEPWKAKEDEGTFIN